ncbi:MAG TPA: ECF-type sigma factor [Rhodanobacteraceae bacterium]|nr:ECF-type sigma factor [Rhodanobacteraceae bacterium]
MAGRNVTGDVTALIEAANGGDAEALRALFARVYDELKLLARRQLADSAGNTLNTTGLVHEVYLKLAQPVDRNLHDRRHFFALAAKAMRQIVIDRARARLAEKRGGPGLCVVGLHEALDVAAPELASEELLRLDGVLARMEAEQPQLAELVELRFFAGLDVADIAIIQSLSERTVVRNWRRAKVRLYGALHPETE